MRVAVSLGFRYPYAYRPRTEALSKPESPGVMAQLHSSDEVNPNHSDCVFRAVGL